MRWSGRRESTNVDDRRGMRPTAGGLAVGGGLGGVILLVIVMLLGGDPRNLPQGGPGRAPVAPIPKEEEDELKQFVGVVLADTEDVWNEQFKREGLRYREPTLVLYTEGTESGCGFADSAVGPFYCPSDEHVYVDLNFFYELRTKFQAPGDFAVAYVLAHEVGHHVQKLLGHTDRVHSRRGKVSDAEFNQLSVRLELQADYLAGVWAHHADKTKNILEAGDLEEAIAAASAVGDDRLQKQSRGRVMPDSFTHGTSEQRARWFRRGFETGSFSGGDTFSIPYEQL